jgi:hypothetical protein
LTETIRRKTHKGHKGCNFLGFMRILPEGMVPRIQRLGRRLLRENLACRENQSQRLG